MPELQEGPSITVAPTLWEKNVDIVTLVNEKIGAQQTKELGCCKVVTKGWNGTFFDKYVKEPVESGEFGQIEYGAHNMSRFVVHESQVHPDWRESHEPDYIRNTFKGTMKKLFTKFRDEWNTEENLSIGEKLEESDQYAAENMQDIVKGRNVQYGEMYAGLLNESPVQLPRGEKKVGDLSLPLNILHLCLRFQILLHNYVAASGISSLWTYAFGPWSGTLLHVEDAFLTSVNLNLGPGTKLWYFVPRSHFRQLQEYYARVGRNMKNGPPCYHHFQHKSFAPTYKALLKEGIPVYYLVQRPGDLIVVEGCVAHEVVNWGYGFSQATNLLTPSWIHVAQAGLRLRMDCCKLFHEDPLSHMVTLRLAALYKRLVARDVPKSVVAHMDMEAGLRTDSPWMFLNKTLKRQGLNAIDFGEPALDADFVEERSGSFKVAVEDIYDDKEEADGKKGRPKVLAIKDISNEPTTDYERIEIVTYPLRSKRRQVQVSGSPLRKK